MAFLPIFDQRDESTEARDVHVLGTTGNIPITGFPGKIRLSAPARSTRAASFGGWWPFIPRKVIHEPIIIRGVPGKVPVQGFPGKIAVTDSVRIVGEAPAISPSVTPGTIRVLENIYVLGERGTISRTPLLGHSSKVVVERWSLAQDEMLVLQLFS